MSKYDQYSYEAVEQQRAAERRAAERTYEELSRQGLSEEEQMRLAFALERRRSLAPYAALVIPLEAIAALWVYGELESNWGKPEWGNFPRAFAAFVALELLRGWLMRGATASTKRWIGSTLWSAVKRAIRRRPYDE